jgi:hypothetical protein
MEMQEVKRYKHNWILSDPYKINSIETTLSEWLKWKKDTY